MGPYPQTTMLRPLVALVLSVALVMAASPAHAGGKKTNLTCMGEVSTGSFRNVTIPEGADCVLTGEATVSGSVTGTNAAGVMLDGVSIGRNVRLTGITGERIEITGGTTIGGNVTITDSQVDRLAMAGCPDTREFQAIVGGNVTLRNNQISGFLLLNCSSYGGNVIIENNSTATDSSGTIQLACSTVAGKAQIRNNETYHLYPGGNCNFYFEDALGRSFPDSEQPKKWDISGNTTTDLTVIGLLSPQDLRVNNNTATGLLFIMGNEVGKLVCRGNDTPILTDAEPEGYFGGLFPYVPNQVTGKDRCAEESQ